MTTVSKIWERAILPGQYHCGKLKENSFMCRGMVVYENVIFGEWPEMQVRKSIKVCLAVVRDFGKGP